MHSLKHLLSAEPATGACDARIASRLGLSFQPHAKDRIASLSEKGEVMASTNQSPQFLRIANDTIINLANVTYVELTGQGGMDLHFVGKTKALHLNATDAEALRDWVSDKANITDLTKASARSESRRAAHH